MKRYFRNMLTVSFLTIAFCSSTTFAEKMSQGETPHSANLSEWRISNEHNRLAAASDWIEATTAQKHYTKLEKENPDLLFSATQHLVQCIDAITEDMDGTDAVTTYASMCMELLKEKKKEFSWFLTKDEDGPSQTTASTSAQDVVFNTTVKKFITNYNRAAQEAKSSQRATITDKKENTVQLGMSKSNAAVIMTNAQGKISSVAYVGAGDGTPQSGTDIIMGMGFAMAGIKPEWPNKRRGDVLKKLGFMSGNLPEHSETIVDNVKFQFSFSRENGIWLIMTPTR